MQNCRTIGPTHRDGRRGFGRGAGKARGRHRLQMSMIGTVDTTSNHMRMTGRRLGIQNRGKARIVSGKDIDPFGLSPGQE